MHPNRKGEVIWWVVDQVVWWCGVVSVLHSKTNPSNKKRQAFPSVHSQKRQIKRHKPDNYAQQKKEDSFKKKESRYHQ